MRRALTILGVLSLLTTLLAVGPVAARSQAQPRELRVVEDEGTDAPAFVTGIAEPARKGSPAELALSHLSSNRSLYEIDAPATDLDVIAVERDEDSSTVRFQQLYKGVEVFGAHYLVHFDEQGAGREVTAVNGSYFTDLTTSVEPRISEDAAETLAVARQRGVRVQRLDRHGLVLLPEAEGVPAFHFTIWGSGHKGPVKQEVFISAQTGAPVLSYNDLHLADPVMGTGATASGPIVDLSVSQREDGLYEMRGFLEPFVEDPPPPVPPDPVMVVTHDAKGKDGFVFNPTSATVIRTSTPHFEGRYSSIGAVDAHWGAERVFEFYKALGRNSIDDEGMEIVSVVDARDAGGSPMYNAFWDGEKMVYGNPEPTPSTREVYPFSADLDVVAHELTHGVIEHTADLVYLNQSGAMNEAYADYFGNAVDVTVSETPMDQEGAGEIAEDLCSVPQPDNWECPLRDLNDGSTVDDFGFYLVDFDNGGVHLNSTIYSGALWDIREGLDPEVADELVYTALESSTPLQGFYEGREAVFAAALQMGLTPEQLDVIDAAFDSRGIVAGWDDHPINSDAQTLIGDIVPLGFYNAAPQASGARYAVGTFADKTKMFEEPQDIVVGNLSGTGSLTRVNSNTSSSVLFDELPDISGEQVVWARGVNAGGSMVNFNVVNRKLGGGMRTIASSSDLEWFPSIDGNLVAWERLRNATDIWARRIGKLPKRITSAGGDELLPQVSGTKIAWWDLGGGNRAPRIGIKDFKTGARTIIQHSSRNAYLGPPALNATHVFWFQDANNNGTGAIMRAKLNGKKKTALVREGSTKAPFYQGITLEPPRISANNRFLVYVDEHGYARASDPNYPRELVGRDVWHMPVKGGTPRVVTCNRGDQAYSSIASWQRTVWLDGSLGRTDLMTRSNPPASCPGT